MLKEVAALVNVEFRNVRGHIEVFIDGLFWVSADTLAEAHREIKEMSLFKDVS